MTKSHKHNEPLRCATAHLGKAQVPTVYLGDNGFLKKFGSELSDDVVLERMTNVVRRSTLGLAAGDDRLLALARRAEQAAGRQVSLMHHSDLPLEMDGHRIRYRRCGSTLLAALRRRGISVRSDPVLRYLEQFDTADALSPDEVARLSLSSLGLDQFDYSNSFHRPDVVTIGGDWLDMLLVCGADELVAAGLTRMIEQSRASNAAVAVTLYVGALTSYDVPQTVDALMLPLNEDGVAMLPTRDDSVDWAMRQETSLIGMHVLGRHTRSVSDALHYFRRLTHNTGVAVIGASHPDNIEALLWAIETNYSRQGGDTCA